MSSQNLSPLHRAVRQGDLEHVQTLLRQGVDFGQRSPEGRSALHVAVEEANLEMVRCLVEAGVPLDWATKQGQTALHRAAECARSVNLMDQDPDRPGLEDWGEQSLEEHPREAFEPIALLLTQAGASPFLTDSHGKTPLHLAATFARPRMAAILLDAGAPVEGLEESATSPLFDATEACALEMVGFFLLRGAQSDRWSQDGLTPVHLAAAGLPLSLDLLELFLTRGADIDLRDRQGNTPLLMALRKGQPHLARYLIQQGADVHASDAEGHSALHLVAGSRDGELVLELLRRGCPVNRVSSHGRTPFQEASLRGDAPTVRVLLEAGAHIQPDPGKSE